MNKKILFVDDEIRVLQGLERMLRGMRHEWDMQFAPGGKEALEILEKTAFDVIVTDIRMPGMDGAQLLNEVMKKYPAMVRIILSGHSDQEVILKSVQSAHQYLSKPCEAETVRNTIIQVCKLQDLLKNDMLKEIISKTESLPSLPSVYTEIVREMNSRDPSLRKVGEIIEKDIGMSAKVLQLVNSAFFGLPRHVAIPSHAVSLLGLEIIKNLVLTIHVFSQFNQSMIRQFSLMELWEHSLRVSRYTKRILELEHCDQNTIDHGFLAGMLHDIGKLVLAVNMPDQYDLVFRLASEGKLQFHEAEERILSASHAETGAYLLGLWGLPHPIIEALAFHHDISNTTHLVLSPLIAVHFSDCLDRELYPKEYLGIAPAFNASQMEKLGFKDKIPAWRAECIKLTDEVQNGQ
jgi:HD-like signal output (HDOD) protein